MVSRFSLSHPAKMPALTLVLAILALGACDGEDAGQPADLNFQITDFRHEKTEKGHQYFHNRIFTTLNGTGVTFIKGRVCVERGSNCVEALVDYRIEGNDRFQQRKSYFVTNLNQDRVTLDYWLKDDAGYEHHLSQAVMVKDGVAEAEGLATDLFHKPE